MKHFLIAFTLLMGASRLEAENLLLNANFAQGTSNWQGDGKTPAEYAAGHPGVAADPLFGKGLIIELDPNHWTKVSQDFQGNESSRYVMAVSYLTSPDLALSTRAADYENIPAQVRFEGYENWRALNFPVGCCFETVSDLDDGKGFFEKFKLKLRPGHPQKYVDRGPPITPFGRKMVTLAFPPERGASCFSTSSCSP